MKVASKYSRQAFTVILLTLALTGLWWWAAPQIMHVAARKILDSNAAESRRTAPDFSLKDATGHTVRLSDYRGRVVLLNFWATWCPPCKIEIPWFVEFAEKYQSEGLTVLGVSMDDDGWKAVRPFLEARNINYPILLGNEEVNQSYGGIDSLPTTLLIGRDGRTEYYHQGLIGKGEYQTEIVQLLKQKKDETRIHGSPPAPLSPSSIASWPDRRGGLESHLFRSHLFR